MQYKGEDLDLRVPQVRAPRDIYASDFEHPSANGRWSRAPTFGIGNGEPLWVDETLLACCNYAFDVAQANGAAEVDLEHLVNALTRVEAAARVLENRGVREGYLRRESAALIASEVPAANAGEAVSPRRSADFEDILRHASDLSQRRGSPASVDDVLWVLLHYGRELPVVQLLRRLTPDWQRLDWMRIREPKLPEPTARPVPVQLVANDSVHARMAGVEDSLRLMQSEFAAERKLMMDMVREIQRDVVAQRGDAAAFRGDLGQRLESFERALSVRSEPHTQTLLADRLARLEQSVQGSLAEALRGTREMAQRLGSIETALANAGSGAETGPLGERMATLEKAVRSGLGEGARNWANLGQRLTAFEANIGDGSASRFLERLGPRLDAIERRLAEAGNETERERGDLIARIEAAGKGLETGLHATTRIQNDMADRLSVIETYLAEGPITTPATAPDLGDLPERLSGLDRAMRNGFSETVKTMSHVVQRLVSVEHSVQDRQSDSDALLILEDRIGALGAHGERTLTATNQIAEQLKALAARPVAQAAAAIDTAALVKPIEQQLTAIEGTSIARVDQVREAVAAISTRIDQLDERMRTGTTVTEEALRGRDQDFDFIYKEIKEVAQSQVTLNSAVSDWRSESQEHFSALTNRLDGLRGAAVMRATTDAPAPEPTPTMKAKDDGDIIVNGSALKKGEIAEVSVKADDYDLPPEPSRGFKHWLFGTSSVATANRENRLKIGRMRDNIRETRERRRTEV